MDRATRLETYQKKRDFKRSPEPPGGDSHSHTARHFVVQKHAARRLHYDFRLELDGVLLSWAVPKGPSLDPADRRLAVHVEDHPIDYETFEGVIPQGEYGGGTVMLWDRGLWEPEGDPRKAYEKGRLKFRLKGERLEGGWTLVRNANDDKNWLLIKRKDKHARKNGIVDKETRSVATGRTMEAISQDQDRVWSTNGYAGERADPSIDPAALTNSLPAPMPKTLVPQLATLGSDVPEAGDWLHELKFDGYRIVAFVEKDAIRLVTRNAHDWTRKFPTIREALQSMRLDSAILDGEVVSVNDGGTFSFQALQAAIGNRRKHANLAYYLFDLPYLGGHDLSNTPLRERKKALAGLLAGLPSDSPIRFSDHVEGKGKAFFDFACRSGQEGIISKSASSSYLQKRTRHWLKVKCIRRQEFVIGGYTAPSGSRIGFGSLLLGVYEGKKLRYCGKVGTGFTDYDLDQLTDKLQKLARNTPAFDNPPRHRDVYWTTPKLVAEVAFAEWTRDGHLRHPSFKGLREDKPPSSIQKEKPVPPPMPKKKSQPSPSRQDGAKEVAGVPLSNPERILYPDQGLTKQDLAEYYEAVAEWMLPHVAERPLMVLRCPRGRNEKCFYQKHTNESLPESVKTVRIKEKRKEEDYLYIKDLRGIVALVQLGTLEFHPWGSRVGAIESPDRLIFDVDPDEDVEWSRTVTAARRLHALLETLGLQGFVKTTGGKGLHVVFPIRGKVSWDTLKAFSGAVVREMAEAYPDEYVGTMSKEARKGKIFIDYFRNSRGATAIAPYSTRARPGAPVATPLSWSELGPSLDREQLTAYQLPRRLAARKTDPWAELPSVKQTLSKPALRAMGIEP